MFTFIRNTDTCVNSYSHSYEFVDWVYEKIDWCLLLGNPAAIDLIRKTPKKIDWKMLSSNPAAIKLLRENPSTDS